MNSRDFDDNTPLFHAFNIEKVKILIGAGGDVNAVNKFGVTPLMKFSSFDAVNIVKILLENGADVFAADNDGNKAIHYCYDKAILEILIEYGADYEAKNKSGRTPFAIFYSENIARGREKEDERVTFLREMGADIPTEEEIWNPVKDD